MMKTILNFLTGVTFVCLMGGLLWSCEKWELPTRKTQRNCVKPSGTLTAQIQQRKVDFSITGSSGTIDKVIWDFGSTGPNNTTVTTGLSASYTYPTSGTYTAKATLSNTCGNETTLTLPITVADATVPTVSLQPATNLSINSAMLGMTVTSNGNAAITGYGICYSSTNMMPEISKSDVSTAQKPGPIALNEPASFSLTNLQPNTLYYVRGFAVNQAGPGYSNPVQTFRTGSKPSVNSAVATNVGITTASANFVVTNPGTPAAIEYGICYSLNSTPDVTNATNTTVITVATPAVSSNTAVPLSNLAPSTKYYYRAYTKLATGEIIYSPTIESFTTQVDTLVQNLIASVSFTDGSLLDVSGNNNHVMRVGDPTFTTDRKGKANAAIQLDGLKDYFYMNDNSTLRPDAFSIGIWIKPIALTLSPDGWMQIYNKSNFNTGANEMYSALIRPTIGASGITLNTDIKQGSNCQNSGWQTLTIGTGIELNKWYHIVFTYNGGQVGRMYINGQLLSTKSNLSPTGIDKCPGGDLKFGAQAKIDPNYFYGGIDDIRIYSRVLSDSEVQALYNQ